MFANVLAAALRNLARNRLYAAISVVSLALGMAAALLTGLYVRDELTFDRFVPGYRDVFVAIGDFRPPGGKPLVTDVSPPNVAAPLKADFQQITAVARLAQDGLGVGLPGRDTTLETVGWVDPDFFKILPLPTIAGDADATMRRPDGVVITRAIARKLFGRDAPIGELLQFDRTTTLRVGAVLEDLPSNTHLAQEIYASGLNAASSTRLFDARSIERGGYTLTGRTYVRAPAASGAALNAAMPAFVKRHFALPDGKFHGGAEVRLILTPLSGLHFFPIDGSTLTAAKEQGRPAVVLALGLIGGLVLLMACANFVNVMTARAARRAVEVGVRKAAGAARRHLIAQFIGEAVVYALLALVLSVALVELALPMLRGALDRPLVFAYWRDPSALAASLVLSLVVGVLAGVYPALVQSAFKPATVLKGELPRTTGSAAVRSGLTVLQFAFLIGLILSAAVIARQTRYALNDGLKVDKDQVLLLRVVRPRHGPIPKGVPPPQCRDALPERIRSLPGVIAAACSSSLAFDTGEVVAPFLLPNGGQVNFGGADIDYGFLELLGVKPVAGRFFRLDHPEDAQGDPPKAVILNQQAARMLGYPDPEQLVGRTVRAAAFGAGPQRKIGTPIQVIGVAPDIAFDLVHHGMRPMMYTLRPFAFDTLAVKLRGQDIPQTLRAIDAVWRQVEPGRPPQRRFMDQYLQTVYAAALRQGYLIDTLSIAAVLLAGLGLFGLAAFTAEQRTKEIGVRKSMGASTGDIVRLLLWRFTWPALLANLVAWPAAWWAMDRWLGGFGRHIDLTPPLFLAASTAALMVAWCTVLSHTLRVARAKPVGALRHE